MKRTITLFILFFTYLNCYSQEWELVATGNNGDKYYMKREKVNSYGYPKVWIKTTYKSTYYYSGNKKIPITNATSMTLREFDCSNREIRSISFVIYSSKGTVMESYDFDFPEWHNVTPESVGEAQLNFVCTYISE